MLKVIIIIILIISIIIIIIIIIISYLMYVFVSILLISRLHRRAEGLRERGRRSRRRGVDGRDQGAAAPLTCFFSCLSLCSFVFGLLFD